MKILQIHKYFFIKGGASGYFFEVSRLLENKGHEVAFFSIQDPHNQKSKWTKYFARHISYEKVGLKEGLSMFLHMLYSFEARSKISRLLDDFKPDVAHIHSIYHHLSPSIILELKKRGIPIVQTLHDYHLIAPSHTLFHDGQLCEVTKKKEFYRSILHRCIKHSYLASIAETIEQYVHSLMGIYIDNVNMFIAPSRFLAQKIEEYGIPHNKIQVLHNFCASDKKRYEYKRGNYILYFGRLSPEKGLTTMVKAAALLPSIPFKIMGEGPQKEELVRLIDKFGIKNVELVGQKTGKQLHDIIVNSRFVTLPSLSYEIFPMSILEAFSLGKPAVSSDLGGLTELVINRRTGLLFKSGDSEDYVSKIRSLWSDLALTRMLGENAKEFCEKYLGEETHYEELLKVYANAIGKRLL